jgi:multidrug efflux pump subunit AcrA (membrane-fusion protein)
MSTVQAEPLNAVPASSRPASSAGWDALRQLHDDAAHARAWLDLMIEGIGGAEAVLEVVVVLGRANTGPFAPLAQWPQGQRTSDALAQAAEQALSMRNAVQIPGPMLIWAVPLLADGDIFGVVGLRFRQAAIPARAHAWMRWGQGWLLASALRSHDAQADIQSDLMFMVDAVLLAMSGDDLKTSVQSVLVEVAHRFEAERVAVGISRPGKSARLWAISHAGDFSGRLALTRGLEAAMDEAVDQASLIELSASTSADASAGLLTRAHQDYLRLSGSAAMLTVPCAVERDVTLVFAFEWARPEQAQVSRQVVTGFVPVIGRVLTERRRASASWLRRLSGDLARAIGWVVGPRRALLKLVALLVVAGLATLHVITVPLEIPADARLEGAVVRQVHAPFDGYVMRADLRAGAVVKTNTVLAVLDDRDLRLDVERWASEQAQYRSQYQDAQAQKNLAQLQINLAQLRQAEAQKALAEANLGRARVLAPMDALVVSGDLSQALGGPVRKGDLLFELAPLDQYRVAIQVDERDIDLVRTGQTGRLMLTALAGQTYPIEITAITPVAEAADGKNRFRVEATLQGDVTGLRPGMKGVVRIDSDPESLLWAWVRGLAEWARLTAWKWVGV